ncbi:hypothetical protein ACQPYA_16260 [Micromonospora sp. CA-263727]|uniref:hypothetical protein n=1 Tax=Micromonospora sp. CA-263727 TaxID=3239967 RepID=UPI003D8B90AF
MALPSPTQRQLSPDDGVRRRLALYRMHLHLLMTVEMPSRGITPANDPGRHALLAELLDRDLAGLSGG